MGSSNMKCFTLFVSLTFTIIKSAESKYFLVDTYDDAEVKTKCKPQSEVDSADYTFYLGNNNVRDANQVMIDSSVNINGMSAEVDEVENSGLNLPQPWLQQRQQLGFW